LLIKRISGDRSKPLLRKLQPELRIRESCGFALHVSRTANGDASQGQRVLLEKVK
jgi:hypothetical protein